MFGRGINFKGTFRLRHGDLELRALMYIPRAKQNTMQTVLRFNVLIEDLPWPWTVLSWSHSSDLRS